MLEDLARFHNPFVRSQRQRHNRILNLVRCDNSCHIIQHSQYRYTVESLALLAQIVIHIAGQTDVRPRVFSQFSDNIMSHQSSADNNDGMATRLSMGGFQTIGPQHYATTEQQGNIQEEKEDEDDTRGFAVGKIQNTCQRDRGGTGCQKDIE